jgi:3-deoxy-D-manno-octulosonic-acid transferase
MLWLYRTLFLPLLIAASPYYLLRMKRRGGYRRHFSQRLGAVPPLPPKSRDVRRVWLQAVSVGEILAIGPLLEAFRNVPTVEVYLSTTTSTGYKLAKERYQELTIGIGYFPVDWWLFSKRAWSRISPDLVILTEGERWPEHVNRAAKNGVPVVCVNARMSDRSFRRMQQWKWAVSPLIRGISHILACSPHDAARFVELGFPAERVTTTGNIKLDVSIPALSAEQKKELRAQLGLGDEPVLLGSSTWPGEEAALVNALRAARASGLPCRLLLVPRHAERRGEIQGMLQETGLSYHLRSYGHASGLVDVAVADTTGELRKLTQLADVVFVGKSLPPHDQGQTPVEAAALGKAILHGTGMSNFRVIARELSEKGATRVVANADELAAAVQELLRASETRAKMSAAAQEWHRANQGAVQRTVEILKRLLERQT